MDSESAAEQTKAWPAWVRVPLALVISACGTLLAMFSTVLILDPRSPNPLLAQCIGAGMVLVSLWLVSLGFRLAINRKNTGGLLSPTLLRIVAVYSVAFPTFLLVAGHASEWPWWRYLQAVAYVGGGIGLWRLAARRAAGHFKA